MGVMAASSQWFVMDSRERATSDTPRVWNTRTGSEVLVGPRGSGLVGYGTQVARVSASPRSPCYYSEPLLSYMNV
eukprot:scaffold26506_cov46-Prasinocladus_malaysianus.AAC.1